MQISSEASLNGRLDRLCAAEGHASVFRRCGPTARRLYRAGRLWRNAMQLAAQDKGVEAVRQHFHALYLNSDQATEVIEFSRELLQDAHDATVASFRCSHHGLTKEQKEYALLSLKIQMGPLQTLFDLAFSRGTEAREAEARMKETIKLLKVARARYAKTGVPTLPRDFDLWAYDAVEHEDAGLEHPVVKTHFCSGLLDDNLLVFLIRKMANCTMAIMTVGKGNLEVLTPQIKGMAEEMTQLVPSNPHGWHILGWVHARCTLDFRQAIAAYEKGWRAALARGDEDEHAVHLSYCHMDALLKQGALSLDQLNQQLAETRERENRLRPLGPTKKSSEKATLKKALSRTKAAMPKVGAGGGAGSSRKQPYIELNSINCQTPEEYQAKLAELHQRVAPKGGAMFHLGNVKTEIEQESKCDGCQRMFGSVMRCSRCKRASYCSTACQRKAWPTHKKECQAPPNKQTSSSART